MFAVWETVIFLCLVAPFICVGLFSNGTLLFLIFKNMGKQSALNILSLPFFFSGLFSSLLLLPAVIVNFYIPLPILCRFIGISHYTFQILCIVTLFALIFDRSLYIFCPQFLTKSSTAKITTITSIFICLVTVPLLLIIFHQNLLPTVIPSCQIEDLAPSSLRLSLYLGIGIFITLLLWAVCHMMEVLIKQKNLKSSGINGCRKSNLVSIHECFGLLILNTATLLLSPAIVEVSIMAGSAKAVFWTYLITIILGGNLVFVILLPLQILIKSRQEYHELWSSPKSRPSIPNISVSMVEDCSTCSTLSPRLPCTDSKASGWTNSDVLATSFKESRKLSNASTTSSLHSDLSDTPVVIDIA